MLFSHPNYTVIKELGRGASATVYLAVQKQLNRKVALKVVKGPFLNEDHRRRFKREARILARFDHPHIVPVYALDELADSAGYLLAMRYVSGGTLRERAQNLSVGACVRVIAEIAEALSYAHANGFLHRDVKPENIVFDGDRAMLTDFGVARATASNTQLTQTGAMLGTPAYMSPELVSGAVLDGRSDLYSLGIVLYELLAGARPFESDSAIAAGVMHVNTKPPPLPQAFAYFQPCLDRLLAKDPLRRPADAGELRDELEHLSAHLPMAPHESPTQLRGTGRHPVALAGTSKPERRQLTVMCCELIDFSTIAKKLDPEDLRDLVLAFRQSCETIIRRYGGHIAQHLNDGLLVYFGYPAAHEDDAARAVHAGLEFPAALPELNARLQKQYAVELNVRIGINTGPVVIGESSGLFAQDHLATGQTPTAADLIKQVAPPNSIVVSESTRNLLGGTFSLSVLKRQPSWDVDLATYTLFEVLGSAGAPTRFSASTRAMGAVEPFGRDKELEWLRIQWRKAQASGHAVIISGEAGIGKSCVTNKFLDELSSEQHNSVVYQCSPYHSDTALFPVTQQLSHAARLNPADSQASNLDRLEAVLRLAEDGAPSALSLLGSLLGFGEAAKARYGASSDTPQKRRDATLQTLVDHLCEQAEHAPLVVLLEDVHWIDPTTLTFVDLLLEQIAKYPILVLLTMRPGLLRELDRLNTAANLELERLEEEAIALVVARATNNRELPAALVREVVAKTDGVPLFAEELAKTVLLSIDGESSHKSNQSTRMNVAIPSSLHDSLMARLDRMQRVKPVAQIAACIGREFSLALLQRVAPLRDEELADALEQLMTNGLIHEQPAGVEKTYLFKHALVRDAAYESLLKSERKALHSDLAAALAVIDGTPAEIPAHHATEAEQFLLAASYWEEAGNAATERAAFSEAIGHFAKGIECVRVLDDTEDVRMRELNMLVKQGHASTALNGFAHPATVAANAGAWALLDRVGETPYRFPVLYGHWVILHAIGQHPAAMADARAVEIEAQRNQSRVQMLMAARMMAASMTMLGELSEAVNHFERFSVLYDEKSDNELAWQYGMEPSVSARSYQAIALLCQGRTEQARACINGLEEFCQKLNHMPSTVYALAHLSLISQVGRLPERERYISLTNQLVDEHDLMAYRGHALGIRAMYLHDAGQLEASANDMSRSLDVISKTKTNIYTPLLYASYAACLAGLDRATAASEAERTAFEMVEASSETWALAEIQRLVAVAHERLHGATPKVLAGLERAIATADAQGARLWSLRARVSLAGALSTRGERDRAVECLKVGIAQTPAGGAQCGEVVKAKKVLQDL